MWQFLLLGYFLFGTTAYLVRRSLMLHHHSSSRLFNLIFWLVFFMPSGWIIGVALPHTVPSLENTVLLFFGAIFWPIVGLVGFRANKEVDTGFYAILNNLAPVITLFLAVTWLQEVVTSIKLFGIVLLILSGIIVAIPLLRRGSHSTRYGFYLCMVTVVAGGVGAAYERWMLGRVGLGTYMLYAWTFQAVWVVLFARHELTSIIRFFKHADAKAKNLVIVFGIANVLRTICFQSALFISGSAAIISASTNFLAVTVLIGAYFFLHEKQHLLYKIVAAGVGITGLLLVTL